MGNLTELTLLAIPGNLEPLRLGNREKQQSQNSILYLDYETTRCLLYCLGFFLTNVENQKLCHVEIGDNFMVLEVK